MNLSVITLAKNEERNIRDCLQSVQFADEWIVIDDCSADATAQIAQKMGASVYQRAMNGDYASQYNFAVDKVTGDWILIVDADERVTPELKEEILRAMQGPKNAGYVISHLNMVMGKPLRHGGWYSNGGLRLFPRGTVVHEGLVHSQMKHSLNLHRLKSPYFHYPYPTWERYFQKFNAYTQLSAQDNYRKGKRANFFFDVMLRPWVAFFKMYILKSGWRDGKIGFVLAVFHFFYTMAKYVRLYYIREEQGQPK